MGASIATTCLWRGPKYYNECAGKGNNDSAIGLDNSLRIALRRILPRRTSGPQLSSAAVCLTDIAALALRLLYPFAYSHVWPCLLQRDTVTTVTYGSRKPGSLAFVVVLERFLHSVSYPPDAGATT
jgi:hypothetical protein